MKRAAKQYSKNNNLYKYSSLASLTCYLFLIVPTPATALHSLTWAVMHLQLFTVKKLELHGSGAAHYS